MREEQEGLCSHSTSKNNDRPTRTASLRRKRRSTSLNIFAPARTAVRSSTGSSSAFFFFQAEDGIRDIGVTGVQTCALPIFTIGTRAPQACRAHAERWFTHV